VISVVLDYLLDFKRFSRPHHLLIQQLIVVGFWIAELLIRPADNARINQMQHFPEPEVHHDIASFQVFDIHQRGAVIQDRLQPRLVLHEPSLRLLTEKDILI
jgi:hypothetical protein